MNVLWLAPIPLIDITESHPAPWIMTLAKSLSEQDINLTIINYNSKINRDILKFKYQNIHLIYVKTPKLKIDYFTLYQLRIQKVRKYLKSIIRNFDMVHIHGTEHQYEAMLYGLHNNVVISIQGIISECVKEVPLGRIKVYMEWKLSSIYELMYIKKYNIFSCRTHWDSGFIRSRNLQSKIYMIWEMIREEFFHDHYSEKKENILFVGGKNPIKGLKELLIAYNNSVQKLGFKLIVLGNCTIEDIENIINKEELYSINIDNVDCRGMKDSQGMIKAYSESYCLVHPTYIDNSPNSVCEAQLSGLPVIATDVGGVSSLIEHEKTGLLIQNGPKAIEQAIIKLYEDDLLRGQISKQSRLVARERHNPNTIVKQTLAMYEEIINEEKK